MDMATLIQMTSKDLEKNSQKPPETTQKPDRVFTTLIIVSTSTLRLIYKFAHKTPHNLVVFFYLKIIMNIVFYFKCC